MGFVGFLFPVQDRILIDFNSILILIFILSICFQQFLMFS